MNATSLSAKTAFRVLRRGALRRRLRAVPMMRTTFGPDAPSPARRDRNGVGPLVAFDAFFKGAP